MAKDVDLSSKEWRDIVFEGKNKEFGAYELRKESDVRHNKAMIVSTWICTRRIHSTQYTARNEETLIVAAASGLDHGQNSN